MIVKHFVTFKGKKFLSQIVSIMKGAIRVLVKVLLFQLRGYDHPKDDSTANFFPDSKSVLFGLSNEVSFVSGFHKKGG